MRVGDPDGHGLYGRLEETEDGLVCHDCGRVVRHLATHARMAHGYADAAAYRRAHGLLRGQRLVSRAASEVMSRRWRERAARGEDMLGRLQAHRDPARASEASRRVVSTPSEWSPAARASRRAYGRSRAGRALTAGEAAWLGDDVSMEVWCRRARALLEDPAVSARSIGDAVGVTAGAVQARLRRYPG